VSSERARQQVGLAENLEPVADAEDRPAAGGVALHRLHHRAEPGDGAGPEVIAVAEPARQDDDIRALQIGVAVPHEVGPGTHGLRGAECVEIAVAAGEPHHRDVEHQLSSTWSR
jgi:hypothetical protein